MTMNYGCIKEKKRNDTILIIVHEKWDKCMMKKNHVHKVVGNKGDMLA